MVKKLQKINAEKKSGVHLSGTVRDSAHQIWLAGLGAFAKAQEEGNKVFDTLVKEGLSIQRNDSRATVSTGSTKSGVTSSHQSHGTTG